MKKIMIVIIVAFSLFFLSGCGILRERLLAPPDEWTAPEGTQKAVCTVEDVVYTYVYKDDGVYQYFLDDVLQGDEELNDIQEQAFLNGESVENYLMNTYDTGQCEIEDYEDEE